VGAIGGPDTVSGALEPAAGSAASVIEATQLDLPYVLPE